MRTLLSNIFRILFQFHFLRFYYRRRWAFKLSVCVRFKELNKDTLYIIYALFLLEEKPQNIYYIPFLKIIKKFRFFFLV